MVVVTVLPPVTADAGAGLGGAATRRLPGEYRLGLPARGPGVIDIRTPPPFPQCLPESQYLHTEPDSEAAADAAATIGPGPGRRAAAGDSHGCGIYDARFKLPHRDCTFDLNGWCKLPG